MVLRPTKLFRLPLPEGSIWGFGTKRRAHRTSTHLSCESQKICCMCYKTFPHKSNKTCIFNSRAVVGPGGKRKMPKCNFVLTRRTCFALLTTITISTEGNTRELSSEFVKELLTNVDVVARADLWYKVAVELSTNQVSLVGVTNVTVSSLSSSFLHLISLRSIHTCLRLDRNSATCHTQLGALRSNSLNATEQLLALSCFKRAAQLQPSVR